MIAVRAAALVLGLVLLQSVLRSAVRTVVVPRGEPVLLTRVVFLSMRSLYRPLAGRSVAEVLAVERQITAVEPSLTAEPGGNWEIEFFNSDRYNAARNRRAPRGHTDAAPQQ